MSSAPREGFSRSKALTITLIGNVNAGKSFLMNRILRQPKNHEVSPVAGWTKEVKIRELGTDLRIADTPGLEDPDEAVARQAFDFIGESDIFLHIINGTEGATKSVVKAHELLRRTQRPVVLVCNKAGFLDSADRESVATQLLETMKAEVLVFTDAKSGDGVDQLVREIWTIVGHSGDELRFARYCTIMLPEIRARLERANNDADSAVKWGTGRAAAIAISPIPLADVYPLIANQIYMAKKIGEAYGMDLSDSVIKGLLAAMGASFLGLTVASFLPGFKIGIAAGVTYGVGKTIKAWCYTGGQLTENELRSEFEREKAAERARRRVDES